LDSRDLMRISFGEMDVDLIRHRKGRERKGRVGKGIGFLLLPSSCACSYTITVWPEVASAMAVDRPPRPAPTMSIFNRTLCGEGVSYGYM
jgi:hypothetical protein